MHLLHGFPIYLVRQATELPEGGLPLWVWDSLALGGVLLAAVLASEPVARLARPLVEPRVPWLLRPPPEGGVIR